MKIKNHDVNDYVILTKKDNNNKDIVEIWIDYLNFDLQNQNLEKDEINATLNNNNLIIDQIIRNINNLSEKWHNKIKDNSNNVFIVINNEIGLLFRKKLIIKQK